MKKIDFHIHTVPTVSDAHFSFELSKLKQYVDEASLDAIAVTNHNVFDRSQFAEISAALDVVVFPGLEVTLDCGHALIVADIASLDSFEVQAKEINTRITQPGESVSIEELFTIFSDLNKHLVIPHYDKKPGNNWGQVLICHFFIYRKVST